MKLISLQLCNFRQFYGKTPEINLASGKDNTTIIYGNNGAGKTTILNAFTWVLYERFTAAFASPEQLVNKRAITQVQVGKSVECWVAILFEHENKRYQVKRLCYVYQDQEGNTQYGQNKLFMQVGDEDGRWYPPMQQPIDIIQGILPESLHQYFFFDGERIDHIFRTQQKSNIAEDTKELLGVKVLDRAIEHLKRAKRTLLEELQSIGEINLKIMLKEQDKLETQREELAAKQQQNSKKIEQLEREKQTLNQRLLELGGAEQIQQLKTKLEQQERNLRQSITQSKTKLRQTISSRAYTVLLEEPINQFRTLVDNLRQRGELPTGIKKQFVQALLSRQECICGSELIDGTDNYNKVKSWMERAGVADVEEAAIRMETQVNEKEQQVTDFWQELDTYQQNISQWRIELAQVENELLETKKKLRYYPDQEIQNLQQRLDTIETTIRELTLDQGANQQQLTLLDKAIATQSRKINQQQLKAQKQSLAQKRIQVTQEAIERINEVRLRLERQFRLSLEQRVQEIFSSISFTPYIPRLSKEYELQLIENTSGISVPVAASTGENQILSLSFIGGIIDRVREWSQKNTLMGPDSSTFPIVMDSPFGSLDEIYRRQVAQSIPQLANQLIVLVTKTQWRGEVAQEMTNYIGQEYVLVYHSPKPDCEADTIELAGVSYPLVQRSNDNCEYTEIIRVQRERT